MKNTMTNSMLCTLIHITKNQIELKRNEISQLSQYTTKAIRESYNEELAELIEIKNNLNIEIKEEKQKSSK